MRIKDMDALLKFALSSSETPDPELVRKVKNNLFKEEPVLRKSAIKLSFGTAAAAVITILLISTTAFAAWHFLRPDEVADRFENRALSAAFGSETAVNINSTIISGDFAFTLLGLVSGNDITDSPINQDGEILSGRTYAVVAIEKADGSPMPSVSDDEYGNPSFYVSPYIKGLKPWQVNAHTLRGGYSETVEDGVMYRIIDCDGIQMFADRGVYLGINTGSFYDSQAFSYNEETGELKANPDYDGSSVVFDLPLDKALADTKRAEQYLDNLFAEPEPEIGTEDYDKGIWDDVDWDTAVPVISTIKELSVAETGAVTFSYDFDYGSGTITVDFNDYFADSQTADSAVVHQIASDGNLYAIRISVDEKGVATGMVIVPE